MDSELTWQEAAKRMYETVQKAEQGQWFGKFNLIQLFNIYLVASLLYYEQSVSIMSDPRFDALCKFLLKNYEEVKKVIWHKELLSQERLRAGTGYDLEYPDAIRRISQHYLRIIK